MGLQISLSAGGGELSRRWVEDQGVMVNVLEIEWVFSSTVALNTVRIRAKSSSVNLEAADQEQESFLCFRLRSGYDK